MKKTSMECSKSIKAAEKVKAMKKLKRAQFVYNLVLYSLTSLITCFFLSYSFWFAAVKHLVSSLPSEIPLRPVDVKCFFIVGNLIVFILIGKSKLGQSSHPSLALDMYDEYVARGRSTYHKPANYSHVHHAKEKDESSRSTFDHKPANYSHVHHAKEKDESSVKLQHAKSEHKRDENVKTEVKVPCTKMEEKRDENVKTGMCGGEETKKKMLGEKKEITRVCSQSEEIVERRKTKGENDMHREELNKRVEAFIARVNKQRFLEAKMVDCSRG